MLALTTNWVDWLLAVAIGIPLLIVAVCWLVVYAQERAACQCQKCRNERAWSDR